MSTITTLENFDWRRYLSKYKELQNIGINSRKKAYHHWLTIGKLEGKSDKDIEKINIDKIFLLTTSNNDTTAIYLKKILKESYNNEVEIIYNATDKLFRKSKINELYIIIDFNLDNYIYYPKKYIIYKTNTDIKNIKILEKSDFIWEYSIKNQLTYSSIPLHKIFYMPLPFYIKNEIQCKPHEECLYDVFFDGELSEKILPIIKNTKEKYKVKIAFNTLEDIVNSKIIVNLNLYEDCSFNTDKINKFLNYNNIIISEKPYKSDIYSIEIYKDTIIFIDDINQLEETIQYYLNEDNYTKRINYLKNTKLVLDKKINYIFQKNISLIPNLLEKESYCINGFAETNQEDISLENEYYCINDLQKYIFIDLNTQTNETYETYETYEEAISLENFDWRGYLSKYKELHDIGINSRKKAYHHWLTNRQPGGIK